MRQMQQSSKWVVVVLIFAGLAALGLTACSESSTKADSGDPAQVEPIKGTGLNRVTLSAEAAKRIGIETAPVRATRTADGKQRKVIPYAALLYTPNGRAFTYTSPENRVFVRRFVAVDGITGRRVLLSRGPPVGTAVVTVGSQELFGVEYEVEED